MTIAGQERFVATQTVAAVTGWGLSNARSAMLVSSWTWTIPALYASIPLAMNALTETNSLASDAAMQVS